MPPKVRTRDWGPQFKNVSDLIGDKAKAYTEFKAELDAEISSHAGHAFSRHGYQAGWVEQLIRCVTQITPDQAFSPTGVEGVIREWNSRWVGTPSGAFERIVTTYDNTGNRVVGAPGSGFTPTATSYATSAGLDSGGFLSPELQMRALTKARNIAATLIGAKEAHYPGVKKDWKEVSRIMVVVDATPSSGFGLGFRRLTDPHALTGQQQLYTSRTRSEVLALVEAMEQSWNWGRVDPGTYPAPDPSQMQLVPYNPVIAKAQQGKITVRGKREQTAFNGPSDLMDYLGVEPFWQKQALVVFEYTGTGWKRITMYPCNLGDPGKWAPGTKVPGKPWDGKVRKKGTATPVMTYPVPAWTPQ